MQISKEVKQQFKKNAQQYRKGPVEDRSCNDIICYIIFIIFLILTFVFGLYMMADQGSNLSKDDKLDSNSSTIWNNVFRKYGGIIAICFCLAIIFSVVYLLLVKNFPKCMVYFLIILTFCLLFALFILGIAYNMYGMIISSVIGILMFSIFIYCFKDQIELGIILLKVASEFINQKKTVYLAPLWVLLMSSIYFTFWMIGIVAIQSSAKQNQKQGKSTGFQDFLYAFFIFKYIFMCFFFNYVLTFLIATACAFWYFSISQNYFLKGSGWMNKKHLGSFTFAAIVITIITILRMILESKRDGQQNACVKFCLCCLACVMKLIESYLRVLNENSIIMMCVTGQSYYGSAKSVLFMIIDNFALFTVKEVINILVMVGGFVFAVGLPTIIGAIAIKHNFEDVDRKELDHAALIIFFGSAILVLSLLGTLGKSLSCVFIFYCFDKKMTQLGFKVSCSQQVRKILIFNEIQKQDLQDKKRLQKKNNKENAGSASNIDKDVQKEQSIQFD